jgi:gas vesicle protein
MLKRNALESFGLILTGMAAGAAFALLFAPASGAKTRKRLGRYARRTAEDLWEEGRETIETAADRGKEYFETGKEKAKEAVQAAAETLKENFMGRTG